MTRIMKINNVKETKLWQELFKSPDSETMNLATNVSELCEEASDRMKQMYTYAPQYTLHDERHLLRVTELMACILGNDVSQLNTVEKALLILSAFFHDQGMVPQNEEILKLEKNGRFCTFKDNWLIEHPNYKETEKQLGSNHVNEDQRKFLASRLKELDCLMLTEFLRSTHGDRSNQHVLSTYQNDKRLEFQGINLSTILGRLCLSHTLPADNLTPSNGYNYDEQIGIYKVNLPFLASILRIADILDFDRDRTPEVLLKNIHFTSDVSIQEWEKHRSVEGWSIGPSLIRFTIKCSHPSYESSARKYMDWIDHELMACKTICQNQPYQIDGYQLNIPLKVDRSRIGALNNAYIAHDFEFTLSRNEIVGLLMTDKLYGKEHLCIRELLQNSLDALRYRKALFEHSKTNWKDGRIEFKHYIDSDGCEVLQCTDNGSGMDKEIIQNYFIRVGRSFYRSPVFEKERNRLKLSGNDFDPCSKFGIGFMSCFMLGDRITITTRKDYGQGAQWGPPLIIEIHGLSGLLVIRQGKDSQPVGTTVTIVSRQKPSYLDSLTDKIKLCSVLKGYALSSEFPISGICDVEEIKDNVKIPPQFEKEPTLIETVGINQCITLEQDLSAITKNLIGYCRESFLADENQLPCVKNSYAEWRYHSVGSVSSWRLHLSNEEESRKERGIFSSVPVCIDGILVSGPPGRPTFRKESAHIFGLRNSHIRSGSPALLDVRGDLKPELSPSRNQPDSVGSELLPSWQRLDDTFMHGLGLLWEKLAKYMKRGLSAEEFWKLTEIYDISTLWIPHKTLWDYLGIALKVKNNTVWRLVRNLGELNIYEDENKCFLLSDKDGNVIGPGVYQSKWADHQLLNWKMNTTVLLMCSLDIREKRIVLVPHSPRSENDILAKSAPIYYDGIRRLYVEYTGSALDAITVQTPFPTVNRHHPLAKIALDSKYTSNLSDLQKFAKSFIEFIAETVSTKNNTTSLGKLSYWHKRVGFLFKDVSWDKYDSNLHPPYRIWNKENGWEAINKQDFENWRKVPANRS